MHYEYIARYVDDIIVFSKNIMLIIECLKITCLLYGGVTLPQYCFGGDFEVQMRDRITICKRTHISNSRCQKFKEQLFGIQLKRYETPMVSKNHPEMDDSGSRYCMLIGCG